MRFSQLARKIHYYISIFVLLPFFITAVTGILLILRHHVEAIQPAKINTGHSEITISMEQIDSIIKGLPEVQATNDPQVAKAIMLPSKGLVEVRTKGHMQIQLDGSSGEVLKVAPRYTSFIVSIHEGAFFAKWIRDGVFLPMSILVVVLVVSGGVLTVKTLRANAKRQGPSKAN